MRTAQPVPQSGQAERGQCGHLQRGEHVLHPNALAKTPDVHRRQQHNHDAGHQLGRIDIELLQGRREMRVQGGGQRVAQGDRGQHVLLAAARHKRTEILGKGNGHGGVGARLNDEELRPAEEERPQVAERLAEKHVLSTGTGQHRRQFRTAVGAEDGEQPAEDPQADQHRGRRCFPGHDRQRQKDGRADHGADHERRGVEQSQALLGRRRPRHNLFL